MDFGPNGVFIWASYAAAAIVLAALAGWIILDGARLRRQLDDLERQGIRRRSASEPQSGPAAGSGPRA